MYIDDVRCEADGRAMIGHLAFDDAQAGRVRPSRPHTGSWDWEG